MEQQPHAREGSVVAARVVADTQGGVASVAQVERNNLVVEVAIGGDLAADHIITSMLPLRDRIDVARLGEWLEFL